MVRPWTVVSVGLVLAATTVAAAGPTSYQVDVDASRVRVHLGRAGLLKFLGHDHEIDAPLVAGRVDVLDGELARSTVRLSFESLRLAIVPGTEPASDVSKVEQRMRGPEVLDVARHPAIHFASTSVSGDATEPGRFRLRVRGTLEIKGRSFPVEIPLEASLDRDRGVLEATGDVRLRLRALGIEPPSVASVVNVANDFRLKFDVLARRVAP